MTTTEPTRWQEAPVVLPLRTERPAPRPVAGCPECARLAKLRKAAAMERDNSTIVDCNVLLRMHRTGH
ncbi:hypothetical protein OOK31_34070 [Streptomyces sp. NBC_00249]|uniref:hypothetical protein n=1 Tax=Streptomyces sp. NBC_00249 TaxID=2975690 RepID=UPI00225BA10F|nr:hypothetical protein [Streptomyces sp. NBC_00249]MCX5198855.1 hypothetical protein [Streptomyces sp. NBC_00249]